MRLSVCISTYNGLSWLPEQWQSILDQQLPVDEIIVSDDGSTDGTWEWLQKQQHIGLKLIRQPQRQGARANISYVLGQATGDIVFSADQDDVWMPHKTRKIVEFFNLNPSFSAVFTDAWLIDEFGNDGPNSLWDRGCFPYEVVQQNKTLLLAYPLLAEAMATGATMAFKNCWLKKALPAFAPLPYWHDYWLALLAASEQVLYALPENLIKYRIHPNQQTGSWQGDWVRMTHNRSLVHCFNDQRSFDAQVLVSLAFACRRFDLFDQEILQRSANNIFWQTVGDQLFNCFQKTKKNVLGQLDWRARKWKLLKHYLRGGELLRISFTDLMEI